MNYTRRQIGDERTFVIFSMFFTDFKRNSISRRVAMFLAFTGATPRADG
jgi:hypothetical protein